MLVMFEGEEIWAVLLRVFSYRQAVLLYVQASSLLKYTTMFLRPLDSANPHVEIVKTITITITTTDREIGKIGGYLL